MDDATDWDKFENGASIGQRGTDGGEIIADEDHSLGMRITIERGGGAPFSITCGIYGLLVHTRFFTLEAEAREALGLMKPRLEQIANAYPYSGEGEGEREGQKDLTAVYAAIDQFLIDFP